MTILADVSGSMAEPADGGRRKIDVLREALQSAGDARLVAFSTHPRDVRERLPEPDGGTALHLALAHVAGARRLLVISDGHPDDARLALTAADRLGDVRIDVVYCGPEHDLTGMDFMRRLARGGGGAHHVDIGRRPALAAQTIAALLPPPR